jgi:acetyl esterase/lipase
VNRTRALLLITAVPLLIVLGVLVSAALGGDDSGQPPAPAATGGARTSVVRPVARPRALVAGGARIEVGSGARGATIFRPREPRRDAPVVVFLHGWLAVDPELYRPWIAHLVRGGATVIYPAYQEAPFLDTVSPLPNTLVAMRLALERVHVAPGRLVVAGHSAGGALAADYAASARSAGLPVPAAVFSVYPGRSLRGIAPRIPAVSARDIAAGTRVLALAGADDRVVGSRAARAIVRTATRARATLRIVRDARVDDHGAPQRSDPAARRTFWAPLDRLIAATRLAR